MRTSVSCPRTKPKNSNLHFRCSDRASSVVPAAARGFTLLEVLVVLALVGLLSALALPQMSIIRDRLEFNLTRETFEQDLSGLSYRALTEGRALILSGEYPRDPNAQTASDMPVNELAAMVNEPLEPGQYRMELPVTADAAPLTLPSGWKLVAGKPVIYQASGFCTGGTVEVTVGKQRYTYDLKAPACQIEPPK